MPKLKYLKYSALFPNTRIFGFEEVMDNLNRELEAIENRTMGGGIKAIAFIREQTEMKEPLTPMDLANLSNSWFVVTATSVPSGRGTAKFKDNKRTGLTAARLATEHNSTVEEAKAIVKAMEGVKYKILMFGYSANYALWVHENIGAENWKRPGSDSKWLETHMKRNTGKIIQIIKENAKIRS